MRVAWRAAAVFAILTALGALSLNKVSQATDSRLVHLYVDGDNRIVSTDAKLVQEVLKETEIELGPLDRVEPRLDTPVEGEAFQINVFRASPFMVIDQDKQFVISSPH